MIGIGNASNGRLLTEGARLLIGNITHNETGMSVPNLTIMGQAMITIVSKCRWYIVRCPIGSILQV